MRPYLLLLLIISLFNSCNSEKATDSSVLNLIPENSALLLKINDLESLENDLVENIIISQIRKEAFAEVIAHKLKPLRYVNPETSGLLTLSASNSNNFDFTFIITDSTATVALDSAKNKKVEPLNYQDYSIKKYQIAETTFFTSKIKGTEVLSSSQQILENIIENIEKSIFPLALEKLYSLTDANGKEHIWINLKKADDLLEHLQIKTKDSLKLSSYAGWISLDIDLENDGIRLNGIGIVNDTTDYLSLFSEGKPRQSITSALIPKNVSIFKSFNVTGYTQFASNKNEYLNSFATKDSLLNAAEEIGLAKIDGEEIVLLQTFGTATISDYLSTITSGSIEYQGSEILKLQPTHFLSNYFNPIITDFTPEYANIIGNTFIFSSKEEPIKKVINTHKSGNNLENNLLFKNTQEITAEESSILTLASASGLRDILDQSNLEALGRFLKKSDFKNYVFGSQVVADNGFFHTNYFAKKISKTESNAGVISLFNFETAAPIATTPQFVKNHRTNRQEIAVQDEDNILYLISNKGKLIWKKQLKSAIQGKIHQVDIYKNGKLQLAFTTNNEFLILDRNGKEVSPFTIKHEGGNLNALAVFDYDGKKDYRFVVTQGPKVYMYNNKGKIVSGFKYKKAESDIVGKPQHFRIRKKDYLCFKLANGKLKLLNRVGNVRVKVSEKIDFSENEIKLYKNKFSLTTTKGMFYQIDTRGKIEKTNLNLNADHGMDATSKTLAIINDNILRIREKKVALDLGVYAQPSIFYLNDKIYVSVTDIQNQKSYLFDSQAKPIANFPVYGTSMADMDNDKKPEMVLKNQENSITVYKIR
ncbi:ribonuclease HII [Maribacter sp. R77961]|uniref:ribonuclease HII n=1 Tax=Maribacter sp. R77961 TaxID=3093871 RepID=UPI0037C9FC2D